MNISVESIVTVGTAHTLLIWLKRRHGNQQPVGSNEKLEAVSFSTDSDRSGKDTVPLILHLDSGCCNLLPSHLNLIKNEGNFTHKKSFSYNPILKHFQRCKRLEFLIRMPQQHERMNNLQGIWCELSERVLQLNNPHLLLLMTIVIFFTSVPPTNQDTETANVKIFIM